MEDAIRYLKEGIEKTYSKKGQRVIEMNCKAVDRGINAIQKVAVPASWLDAKDAAGENQKLPKFIEEILVPMSRQEGDSLPVSKFVDRADGAFPLGTSRYEKRGVAAYLPRWDRTKCIQCNQCSFVCPHAAIRPVLLSDKEKDAAPTAFETIEAKGAGLAGLHYRMQLSALDCMGCGNCADICPAKDKALKMVTFDEEVKEASNWEYATTVRKNSCPLSRSRSKAVNSPCHTLSFPAPVQAVVKRRISRSSRSSSETA